MNEIINGKVFSVTLALKRIRKRNRGMAGSADAAEETNRADDRQGERVTRTESAPVSCGPEVEDAMRGNGVGKPEAMDYSALPGEGECGTNCRSSLVPYQVRTRSLR